MSLILIDADTLIDVGWMGAGTSLGVVSVGFLARRDPKEQRAGSPPYRPRLPARASTSTDGSFLDQVDWFRAALIDRSTQR